MQTEHSRVRIKRDQFLIPTAPKKRKRRGVRLNVTKLEIHGSGKGKHCLDHETDGIQPGDLLLAQIQRSTLLEIEQARQTQRDNLFRHDPNPAESGARNPMLMRPSDPRHHTPHIDILGDVNDHNHEVVDLGPEDESRLQAIIETFWSDINPGGYQVEHYANNREAGPSNWLATPMNDAEIPNRAGNERRRATASAQTCVEDIQLGLTGMVSAVTLFASIWRPESANTIAKKGGN